MGQPHKQETLDNFIQSEVDSNHFLSLYVYFLNTFIDDSIYVDCRTSDKITSNISISISLISAIHRHIELRNQLLHNIISYPTQHNNHHYNSSIHQLECLLQANPFSQPFVALTHSPLTERVFDYQFENSIKSIVDYRGT